MNSMKVFSRFDLGPNFGWKPPVFHRLFLAASAGVPSPAGGNTGAPAASPSAPASVPSGPGPGSGSPGAPAASPAAPSSSGAPAPSPSAQPSQSATGQPNGNDANIAVLRQSHELISRLGGPEAIQRYQQQVQVLNQLRTEGAQLAEQLGYTPESFEAAFGQDPADTLAYLRNAANQARANQPEPTLEEVLNQRLGPVEQQLRMQQVERSNAAVDGELTRVFNEHAIFKGKSNIPADAQGFIMDLAREYLKYDQPGLKKVLAGDMSPVGTAFTAAMDRFFKAVNAYTQWNSGLGQPASTGNQPQSQSTGTGNGNGAPKWNINDLIAGNEDAFQGLSTTRR